MSRLRNPHVKPAVGLRTEETPVHPVRKEPERLNQNALGTCKGGSM